MKTDQMLWAGQRALDFFNRLQLYDAALDDKREMIDFMLARVRDLATAFYPAPEERKV